MPKKTLEELLGLDQFGYSPEADPWLAKAQPLVEEAINDLLREFIAFPYLHRREHSIHVRLCALLALKNSPDGLVDLSAQCPLGENIGQTQLIHKEWPSARAYQGKTRRGNVDVVVLPPALLKTCTCIDDFRKGRLPAPIVIEMGLDYGTKHLEKDARKLIDTTPRFSYLVHLIRERPRDLKMEAGLIELENEQRIGIAYGSIIGQKKAFKQLWKSQIEEQ